MPASQVHTQPGKGLFTKTSALFRIQIRGIRTKPASSQRRGAGGAVTDARPKLANECRLGGEGLSVEPRRGGIVLPTTQPAGTFGAAVVCGLGFLGGWYAYHVCRVETDEDGLTQVTPWERRRLTWAQVEEIAIAMRDFCKNCRTTRLNEFLFFRFGTKSIPCAIND